MIRGKTVALAPPRPPSGSTGRAVGSSKDDVQHLGPGTTYGVDREPFAENIKIGAADLVRRYSLLVPQDTVARIAVQIRGWTFSLGVKFENMEGVEPRLQFSRDRDDAATFTLLNWDSPVGVASSSPVEIAHLTDGSKILLLVANQAIGAMNRLELQFLLQEKS